MPSIDRRVLGAGVVVISCAMATPAAQRFALPDPVRAAADAITQAQLAWDVARLSSDELRGRNTPSPGFDAAADYITGAPGDAPASKPLGDDGDVPSALRPARVAGRHRAAPIEIAGRRSRFGARLRRCARSPARSTAAAGGLRRARLGRFPLAGDRSVCRGRRARQAGARARAARAAEGASRSTQIGRVDRRRRIAVRRSGARGRGRRALHHRMRTELMRWDADAARTPCGASSSRRCRPLMRRRRSPRCCSPRARPDGAARRRADRRGPLIARWRAGATIPRRSS